MRIEMTTLAINLRGIQLHTAGAGINGAGTACEAALIDSALAFFHAGLRAAAAPLLQPDIAVTALPPVILPLASDVFALRASLAAVSAAAASPAERDRTVKRSSSGRCAVLLSHAWAARKPLGMFARLRHLTMLRTELLRMSVDSVDSTLYTMRDRMAHRSVTSVAGLRRTVMAVACCAV